MSEFSNVAGVIGIRGEPGMALVHYLRRAPERTDEQELIARDAYVQGYKTGYRHGDNDSLNASTELNTLLQDRRFATALATLAWFVTSRTPAPTSAEQSRSEPEIAVEWMS